MERLPEEIVTDILTRLPVKKLLQFKCVCKLWNSSISDPQFAKLQLRQSLLSQENNNNNKGENFQILVFSDTRDRKPCQPICLDYENVDFPSCEFAESQKLDFPFPFPLGGFDDPRIHVLGYCDGLFCLVFESELFIWNPSIRRYRKIPNGLPRRSFLRFSYNDNSLLRFSCRGFGYDSVLDDYKVVRSFRESEKEFFEVFALKTNQWRTIVESYSGFIDYYQQCSNFLNGSLHWCAGSEPPYATTFVAFNLESEKFLEVPLPDVNGVKFTRVVFNGCLSVYRVDNACSGFEIWVMKEYMVSASWTKLGTVLFHTMPNFKEYREHYVMRPLCYSRDGDILLQFYREYVVKYNMNKKCCSAVFNIKCYDLEDFEYNALLESIAYVESMISVNDDGVRRIV